MVASLGLRSLGPNWADAHRMRLAREEAASRGTVSSSPQQGQTRSVAEIAGPAVLGVMALIGLRMYTWMQSGQTWKAVLLALAALLALGVVGWLVARYKRGPYGGCDARPRADQGEDLAVGVRGAPGGDGGAFGAR